MQQAPMFPTGNAMDSYYNDQYPMYHDPNVTVTKYLMSFYVDIAK